MLTVDRCATLKLVAVVGVGIPCDWLGVQIWLSLGPKLEVGMKGTEVGYQWIRSQPCGAAAVPFLYTVPRDRVAGPKQPLETRGCLFWAGGWRVRDSALFLHAICCLTLSHSSGTR